MGSLKFLTKGMVGTVDAEARELLEITQRNADRLLLLINDLLDLSKLESGTVTLDVRECNLKELVAESLANVTSLAQEKHVRLEEHIPEQFPVTVDRDRLAQVLYNLLSNAIKFTPAGSVTVDLDDSPEAVILSVRDTGIGIPRDQLHRIFDRFVQVDAGQKRKAGGTGLGLAICQAIVEQHGGKIRVESEEGAGSTFYLSLPKTPAAPNPD